ncbi:hypothetical protein [Pseudosulfitobacter pseudonitzschiae]|uniref:hypothetical protein n=1 Tax=Pseudosulfitobacter pseudonitzschiae TaxID=1402135 RepID=UPI001AF7E603|nr:hypothetical protein [Pseudosulfitobacter pseudonitzschiae]MBM1814523.1 hypothetical protein [Pseudosulfitobacter pseudonitzschiae]MBM1831517.1 hypothetical protein [Pseudosulfitobacter pseudonitzschiae]MBM1836383.1 hypothetical protein [Pseudosulfitobacter pseudonitzschiae]MBM1841229.1 hypothetical protein [Pseudosulfitobacter pseudonitzschiae]MBM1846097.1 hypothetical protein [Pseudosulfitobacter pseudonitzschiae]
MTIYVSHRGAEELAALRLSDAPKPTGGHCPIQLLAAVPSEECGCPEELWDLNGIIYLIHMEEDDASGEIFVFAGDWETETMVQCATIEDLRAEMFQAHAELMRHGEEQEE